MADAAEIIEQPRGEDGRFASPTQPADAQAAPVATEPVPATEQAAGEHAPVTAVEPVKPAERASKDPYAAARETLAARAAATTPAVVDRATDATADVAAPTGSKPDAAGSPQPSPKEYDGTLSAKEHALLKSVPGMLPDPAAWKAMGISERLEHLQDVNAIRRERSERFKREQQAAAGQPAQPVHPQPVAPQGDRGAGTSGQATQSPQAGQPAANAALPPDLQQQLQDFADAMAVGLDHPAIVIQRNLLTQTLQLRQDLARRDGQERQAAIVARQDQVNRSIEDAHFTELQAKYEDLKDPAVRERLRADIRDFHAMRERSGRPVSPEEAVRFVTHNTLYPEIQKRQEKQQQANRQRSLSQTFAPGPTPPRTPAPKASPTDESDRYAQARERVNRAAKTGQRDPALVGLR